jgi:hypothetical protein
MQQRLVAVTCVAVVFTANITMSWLAGWLLKYNCVIIKKKKSSPVKYA